MLLRAAHCFAPHFMGNKEISSYVGNFDSKKPISANVFCKGSARKHLGLPGPYSLFGNYPSQLLQSVSDKITKEGCGWVLVTRYLQKQAADQIQFRVCAVCWTLAQTTDQPLCTLVPCSSLGTNSNSVMISTQWRKSKAEHLHVAAAAFTVDVSSFGRVTLKC